MSRVGLKPIPVLKGVEVKIDDSFVEVKGSRGVLSFNFSEAVSFSQDGDNILVSLKDTHKSEKNIHGLSRSLLNNMILGVSSGFTKSLEIQGAGYRAQEAPTGITLFLGYSHSVDIEAPEGIKISVENNINVQVEGNDKQVVGQVAARIRAVRPPGVYTGKGVSYAGEHVRRKQGKGARA